MFQNKFAPECRQVAVLRRDDESPLSAVASEADVRFLEKNLNGEMISALQEAGAVEVALSASKAHSGMVAEAALLSVAIAAKGLGKTGKSKAFEVASVIGSAGFVANLKDFKPRNAVEIVEKAGAISYYLGEKKAAKLLETIFLYKVGHAAVGVAAALSDASREFGDSARLDHATELIGDASVVSAASAYRYGASSVVAAWLCKAAIYVQDPGKVLKMAQALGSEKIQGKIRGYFESESNLGAANAEIYSRWIYNAAASNDNLSSTEIVDEVVKIVSHKR